VPAPVFDRLTIPTIVKHISGTLFEPEDPSIGGAYPNPESDALWQELELARTIPLTAKDVRKLGKDHATVAKFEDLYWHLGDDTYMAQISTTFQKFTVLD
jgi:hypothetical protein